MEWIRSVRCEKFQCDFMPRTCALILPFQPTLHRVSCINERIQNAPKHYQTHQNKSLRSNGWIGFVRCQKFWCDFMARTFALITPIQPVLHRVSCSNETIQNAPKHYETHKNMSLGSNGVDRVCSLRKIPMRLNGTNLSLVPMGWIECVLCEKFRCDFMAQTCALIALVQPVLHLVSCSNETNPKCTQTVRNEPILEFRVQWGGSGAFVTKNSNAS